MTILLEGSIQTLMTSAMVHKQLHKKQGIPPYSG